MEATGPPFTGPRGAQSTLTRLCGTKQVTAAEPAMPSTSTGGRAARAPPARSAERQCPRRGWSCRPRQRTGAAHRSPPPTQSRHAPACTLFFFKSECRAGNLTEPLTFIKGRDSTLVCPEAVHTPDLWLLMALSFNAKACCHECSTTPCACDLARHAFRAVYCLMRCFHMRPCLQLLLADVLQQRVKHMLWEARKPQGFGTPDPFCTPPPHTLTPKQK